MSDEKSLKIENELGLLGCILQDADVWLPMVENKGGQASWFKHVGLRSVWLAVNSVKNSGRPVDAITTLEAWRVLWDKQENGEKDKYAIEVSQPDVSLLERCIEDTPTSAHAEYYADLVRERWIADKARSIGREFSNGVGHGAIDAIQTMSGALQDLMDEATKGGRRFSREMLSARIRHRVADAYRVVMTEGHGKVRYCPGLEMPWRHMNNLYGSAMPGLHIVSGRPSTGKTTLINNFIRFWCDYLKVSGGVNSMDMTPEMFLMRNVAEKSSVSLPKALRGDLRKEQYDRWMEVLEQCSMWNMDLDCIKDLDQFRSWVTVGVRKKGWKFCVIDFIQLMKFKGSLHMGVNDRIEIISGSVKEIANDLDLPIFALSQLSRDCEKDERKPTMSDLRGGGSLEQDAKTILMLYKDKKVAEIWRAYAPKHLTAYSTDAKTNEYMAKRLRPVFAILEKNQDGETGEIPMVMYPNYFRFRLADYMAAEVNEYSDKNPDKITGKNESAKFNRVHSDWRMFPEDDKFQKAGGIVTDYEDGDE